MQINNLLTLVQDAFANSAQRLEASNKARATERGEILAALDQDAIKQLLGRDDELKQQVESARAALQAEERQDKEAEQILQKTSAVALAQVKKLQGGG
jgi:hypothetical protein